MSAFKSPFSKARIFSAASLIGAGIMTAAPASAQYWEVRPSPPSWGLPQSRPQQPATQSPAQTVQTTAVQSSTFESALSCSAAIQLAALASPSWAQSPGVAGASDRWLQQVFASAAEAGIGADQVSASVQQEMNRQAEAAGSDPSALSQRAFDCATRAPG
jgi:hypothetical protein